MALVVSGETGLICWRRDHCSIQIPETRVARSLWPLRIAYVASDSDPNDEAEKIPQTWEDMCQQFKVERKPEGSLDYSRRFGVFWNNDEQKPVQIRVWGFVKKRCMVPHIKNRETADQTTTVLVYMIPKPLQHIGLKFVSFMMDDRLRKAML